MKRIFLHIAIFVFISSLLLALCGQQELLKQPLPAPGRMSIYSTSSSLERIAGMTDRLNAMLE